VDITSRQLNAESGTADNPAREKSLQAVLQRIEGLPSLPFVANKILEQILNHDFDHSKLARIIETDPALTLKVLEHANSATYVARGQISEVEKGLNRLGSKIVQALMLSVLIKDSLINGDKKSETVHTTLWKHSLGTAVYASLIAAKTYPSMTGEAFGAGIMHDLGRVFLELYLPEQYSQVTERMESLHESVLDAEHSVFNTDHTAVGRWIAQKWQLPKTMIDAIWLHHHSAPALGLLPAGKILPAIVALSNILAHSTLMDPAPAMSRERQRQLGLQEMLGLQDADMQAISAAFAPAFAERAEPFNLDGDQVGLFLSSLQKANQQLMRLSLDLEQAYSDLEDSHRFTTLGSTVGLKMSKARTANDVFSSTAQCMHEGVGIRGGFIYWFLPSMRVMQGMIWNGSGGNRLVTYSLDGDGLPFLDEGSLLPESLQEIVLSHHERHEGASFMDRELRLKQAFMLKGYCLFPLVGDDFTGEMCILRSHDRPPKMTQHEYLGYSQVSCVVSGTLERVCIFDSLQLRADELSHALWKNQQINLQLLQTERLAAVGQLAAGAAHEINNPLAIISARTQLMENREQDEKKRKDLHQIAKQIERISSILQSLMGFARPNSPQVTKVDLNTLLQKIIGLVESIFQTYRIPIVKKLSPELPLILADSNQLEQVFLNLIINAKHAMETEGGVLTISSMFQHDGKRISVSVKDTGCGIAPENLSRIFDPFFSTKSEGKGTGLGLSTAYGIVTNHYGEIKVVSEEGKGTEMIVILPVSTPVAMPEKPIERPEIECVPVDAVEGKILVVDDEQHIRDILAETLRDAGYTVVTAANGEDAIGKLQKEPFNLILLDIRMPIHSGLDVLKLLQRNGGFPPAIVITGLASSEEMDDALKLGAVKCIRKPFQLKTLLSDISCFLQAEKHKKS